MTVGPGIQLARKMLFISRLYTMLDGLPFPSTLQFLQLGLWNDDERMEISARGEFRSLDCLLDEFRSTFKTLTISFSKPSLDRSKKDAREEKMQNLLPVLHARGGLRVVLPPYNRDQLLPSPVTNCCQIAPAFWTQHATL